MITGSFLAGRDQISRVRLRGASTSASQLRQEFRLATAALELAPCGWSRATILCVRRLSARCRAGESPWPPLQASLDALVRTASWPAREPVSATTTAVAFADRAELLACLARDWTRGELSSRWWWRTLFGGRTDEERLRLAWLDEPQVFPAAIATLARLEPGLPFLQRLASSDLTTLWHRLLAAFDLPALRDPPETKLAVPSRPAGSRAPAVRQIAVTLPPWGRDIVLDRSQPPLVQRLVIVAALLHQAPGLVRSAEFARTFHRWSEEREPYSQFPSLAESARQPAKPSKPTSEWRAPADPTRKPARTHAPHARPPLSSNPPSVALPLAVVETPSDAETPATPTNLTPPGAPLAASPALAAPESPPFAPSASPLSFHVSDPVVDSAVEIESDWGGIFYLINVALALGLYGDFTSPARAGLGLPVWDFLALFGRRWAGREFLADPLDPLLAQLASRHDGELPAKYFTPPGGSLTDWLDATGAQLIDRLSSALGMSDLSTLTALTFRHRARVEATATRVDVTFSLAAHPLELRLAGLDRDPGWVPAAGRVIAFHYD